MHEQPTCGQVLSSVESLERDRSDVLQHLLLECPATFRFDEAELTSPGEEGRGDGDGYLKVVRDMRRCGLAHPYGVYAWASRAAKFVWVLRTA